MKALKKTVLGAVVALALAGGAQASNINVGGVVWDPDYTDGTSPPAEFDFVAAANFNQWYTTSNTGILGAGTETNISTVLATFPTTSYFLEGAGLITRVNDPLTTFCPSCQLTYAFGGLALTATQTGFGLDATNAWAKIYVSDQSPSLVSPYTDASEWSLIQGGDVWLDMIFASVTPLIAADLSAGAVFAKFTIIDGIAENNFDPLTLSYSGSTGFNIGATASPYSAAGNSQLFGNSIPEPGSLALAGLGLLGLGALRRRKAS